MGRTALLVVDMLYDFINEDGALYCGDSAKAIVDRVAWAIRSARERGEPVIFICDNHKEGDREFEMFPVHCIAGSRGAAILPEIAPEPGDHIIKKRRYSGFYGTDLDLTLREAGVEHVVLVGVCTNICVLYTAADARMRNYRVTVLKDAVASFDEGSHQWALKEMESTLGVEVV
ncbi:MAG: isochorismatase family cysteine hydrolase [Bacillota bacterium]